MKKALSVLLVVVMLLTAAPLSGFVGIEWPSVDWKTIFAQKSEAAETYINGIYTYSVEDGNAEIVFVTSSTSGSITVPTTLDGYPVTSIADFAFSSCTYVSNVDLPHGLISVGAYAFFRCEELAAVTIPATVKTIGQGAFSSCKSLLFATFASNSQLTSLGESAFHGCSNLRSIKLPEGLTTIENSTFGGTAITTVAIPAAVKSIGERAFFNTYLQTVTFAENSQLTSIGTEAFRSCSLKEINIPASVKTIGEKAFYLCRALSSVTIPSNVVSVGAEAFGNCEKLSSMYILNPNCSIGEGAIDSATTIYGIAGSTAQSYANANGNQFVVYCPHSRIEERVLTKATCVSTGTKGEVCTACGQVMSSTSIAKDPSNHANIKTTTVASTCTVNGTTTKKCTSCGTKISETTLSLDPDNHASLTEQIVTAPTCTASGKKQKVCNDCGTALPATTISPTGHSWNSGEVDQAPTCTEYGITKYTCTTCGETQDLSDISPTGHTLDSGKVTTVPTCTAEGVKTISCTVCGAVHSTSAVPATGHSWNNGTVAKKPTCTTSGVKTFYCTVCGASKYETIDSLGHNWDSEITVAPTCTATGELTCTCANCASVKTETLPVDPTNHVGETEIRDAKTATDYEAGYTGDEYCLSCEKIITPGTEILPTYISYGSCGSNAHYTIDRAGVLCISGTGKMKDYSSSASSVPWYSLCSTIKKIEIADGITSIGNYAFFDCDSLTAVTIPPSVTSIGKYAFDDCESLTSIAIPESVTSIGDNAFDSCDSLTSIIIPESVTSIGSYAFEYCDSLESITFGENSKLTSIGSYAFYSCDSLTSIAIPESVTSIGKYAFDDCESLTAVNISDLAAWCNISFGNGYANPLYYAEKLYLNGSLVEHLTIPDEITKIKNYAFRGCNSIKSVTIPDGVTGIGTEAFALCRSLNAVYISDLAAWCKIDFDDYGSNPLCYAGNLHLNGSLVEYLTIPDEITKIKDYAFIGCDSIKSVTIPDGVTSIGSSAFDDCDSLTAISIPSGVTSLSYGAFSSCDSLENVTFDKNSKLTSIGATVFRFSKSLTSITIPESVTSIGNEAFYNCDSIALVTILNPDCTIYDSSNTIISSAVICGYTGSTAQTYATNYSRTFIALDGDASEVILTGQCGTDVEYELTRGGAMTVTGSGSMSSYTATSKRLWNYFATTVELDYSLTGIGNFAFYDSAKLSYVTVPNSVTSIGTSAFGKCSALETIIILNPACSIADSAGTIDESATICGYENSTAHTYAKKYNRNFEALECDHPLTSSVDTVPPTCTEVGYEAGVRCNICLNYTPAAIIIPAKGHVLDSGKITTAPTCTKPGVNSISCTVCGAVTSTSVVPALGHKWDSGKITTAPTCIKTGVNSISCTVCRAVQSTSVVPVDSKNHVNIEFKNATDPTSTTDGYTGDVYCNDCGLTAATGTAVQAGSKFGTCGTNVKYFLTPDGTLTIYGTGKMKDYSYTSSAPWYSLRSSVKKVEIADGITSIGSYAFEYCDALTSITIPESVTSIGYDAFKYCDSLESVTFGENSKLTSIGNFAFYYCGSLTSITIPESVTSIGNYAFGYCYSLTGITIPESVTSIGNYAFGYCYSLTAITIPESVTSIGNGAFYRCSSMAAFIILNPDCEIYDSTDTLGNTSVLIAGYTDSTAQTYATAYGRTFVALDGDESEVILNGQCGTNVQYVLTRGGTLKITGSGSMQSFTSVSAVPWYKYRALIKTIEISDNITSIGKYTFSGCSSLTVVHISDLAAWCNISFGDAFANPLYYAKKLYLNGVLVEHLTIPSGITQIKDYAFYGCESIKSVTIPFDVTKIGSSTFCNCSNLQGVAIYNPDCSITNSASTLPPSATIYGASGSTAQAYAEAYSHKFEIAECDHADIIALPDTSPTCTSGGTRGGTQCRVCGSIVTEPAKIAALGHDEVAHEGQQATCTEIGWGSYTTCTRCSFSSYTELAALGHDEVAHEGQQATCTESGWAAYTTCTRCSFSSYTELVALGHDEVVHEGQEATCTESGFKAYATCSRCDFFEIIDEEPALGHIDENGDSVCDRCEGSMQLSGDVDGDGVITANDARTALRASVGLDTLTLQQESAADVDGSGVITAGDARIILRRSVGLTDN